MKVNILYGSMTGNSMKVAEYIHSHFQNTNIESDLALVAEQYTPFESDTLYLIVTSTWVSGEPNPEFADMYESLQKEDLTGVSFALVGLGDRTYGEEQFCRAIDMTEARIIERGGKITMNTLKIDGNPDSVLNTDVRAWAETVTQTLGAKS